MKRWLLLASVVATLTMPTSGVARADLDAKHLKLVRGVSTSLRQAVLLAERDLKGKAFSAIAGFTDEAVIYTIKLDAGDKALTASVDAKSGKLSQSPVVVGDSAGLLKEFSKIKGTLLAAIKAAEATAKGKAFLAVFKRLGNKDVFEVDIAGRDDVEKDVVIDAATGKIRKVAERSADASASAGAAVSTGGAAQ